MAGTFARHLALIGFATVCLQGLLSNSRFDETIPTALMVALLFAPLGWILGELARWLVEDQVRHERTQLQLNASHSPRQS